MTRYTPVLLLVAAPLFGQEPYQRPNEADRREAKLARPGTPADPTNVVAAPTKTGQVTLSWSPVDSATGYHVYRAYRWSRLGERRLTSTPVTRTTYTDADVPTLSEFVYAVQAVKGALESDKVQANGGAAILIPAPPNARIRGFADTHSHQFANLGFGGLLLWGKPYSRVGTNPLEQMADALPWCTAAHGPGGAGDLIGNGMRTMAGHFNVGHLVGGYPQFDGWPRYDSYTHQQMYYEWLHRAFLGGLKLVVVHAVNNELLCQVANRTLSCDDMEAVVRQLRAAADLERFIDEKSGGPGRGWYRIVRSGDEARRVINNGKLAVVLGIEVDNLFGCRATGGCTEQSVRTGLQRVYDLGVRHIIPIHLTNNGFGGAALYNDMFNYNNVTATGSPFSTFNCSSAGYEFRLGPPVPSPLADLLSRGRLIPTYPAGAHCNVLGLTPLGEFLVRELMNRGMILDIDHMSLRATERMLVIAESERYPVIAGHTGFLKTSIGPKRSEGQKTPQQLERIRALGGMVSAILHQGTTAEIAAWRTTVPNDCSTSSKTWAQSYLHAVDMMGGPASAAVGLGSDFNGLAGTAAPRFGDDGCDTEEGQRPAQRNPVRYPLATVGPLPLIANARWGSKVYDYNVDGLAHVGLLPDFVQDLRNVGLTDRDLEPLFRSAEAYVAMWERIDARGRRP